MDELQTTVPQAPDFPRKHRCPACNGSSFGLIWPSDGHLKAVCPCGWSVDLMHPDTLTGRATRWMGERRGA